MRQTVIGVLGGMGPEATAKFYYDFVKQTKADRDQDHYHVIIDSNVNIPDRTAAIFGQGPSPLDALIDSAKRLQTAGATIACIPCMTAHYFYDAIADAVDLPIVHAMDLTNTFICDHYPTVQRVGVLCTSGTRNMRLFDAKLTGFQLLYPTDTSQRIHVMEAIYGQGGIKHGITKGTPVSLLKNAAQLLIDAGAELIVAGCTEIPLALHDEHIEVPLVDAMQVVIDVLQRYP